jgi:hypothetical protein
MVGESNQRLKIEFADLKLLPREYSGPRHIVSVSNRPDGRGEYEERPGEPPPDHAEDQDPNVMRLYLVRHQRPPTKSVERRVSPLEDSHVPS